jgi:hypothetical protein
MGKNKTKKNSDIKVEGKSTVSIVTITQLKRSECLLVLRDMIKTQTYKKIIEWVIVEGSKTLNDANKNKEHIELLRESVKDEIFPKIVYVEY